VVGLGVEEDIVKISSDSSSCSSRKRVCRHIKVESDDSDYLPSLEELCSKPVLPEKETNLVQKSSVSDKHFMTIRFSRGFWNSGWSWCCSCIVSISILKTT
jgi:hypothetical protein